MRKNYIQNGFALLYSIIVVGAMMSLVFGVLNIVYKQIALSGVNKDSEVAFYAANSGLECGQYWSTYGAFNPDNPSAPSSNPFSTIQCLNTSISNNPLSSDNIPTTIANFVSGTPYYSSFTYPLGAMYSGSSVNISSTVQVLQNTEFTPNLTATNPDITTEILSAGVTGNNPNQVQRGVGETAGVTQCLAPAFTYTVGSLYPSWGSPGSNPSILPSKIDYYFPGLSVTALENNYFPTTINQTKTSNTGNQYFLPYITYLMPDDWSFTPPNLAGLSPAPSLTLSATSLLPPGYEYKFGYYASSSPTGGASSAENVFIPIYDSSATSQQYVSIPANTSSIHFALEIIDSSGNITDFWSTYFAQNAEDTGNDHVLVIATPIPTTINANPNNQYTRISGKYIFGFDTHSSLPQSPTYDGTFDGVIIALQLAGCP